MKAEGVRLGIQIIL
ncbi:hypothetical protein A2U01_0109786, partial [Trifolium medium]|nr:hypothetical protein [Trifolium medium]